MIAVAAAAYAANLGVDGSPSHNDPMANRRRSIGNNRIKQNRTHSKRPDAGHADSAQPPPAKKLKAAGKITLEERREMPSNELWNSLRQGPAVSLETKLTAPASLHYLRSNAFLSAMDTSSALALQEGPILSRLRT